MEQNLFAASWKNLLRERASEPAVFATDGSVLRTFEAIEAERIRWRERLSNFSKGDCVVAAKGNEPDWPAFILACWDQFLVAVPVEAEAQPAQLDRILQLVQAQGLVLMNEIRRFDCDPIQWTEPRPHLLKITSGTTGSPRAVRVRESHLLADCRNICQSMEIRPDDTNFGVIPFAHSYGFSNLVTPLLYQGTRLVCSSDRIPRALCSHLETSRATVFAGTPALFQALGSLSDVQAATRLRTCISAGAPLTSEISRQFSKLFGLKIHSFYGSSECGGIAYDRSNDPNIPSGLVGTPMHGVEVVALENDRIAVIGPNVADDYFPLADHTTLGNGRFIPGDIVTWSDKGMQLVGRITDIINVAGKKVHPSIVEDHLRKFPEVLDAIVFGIPSITRNEDLIAYVVGTAGLKKSALENHCREGLAVWQVPREFQIVDSLPVNQRGKINRAELAKLHLKPG